MIYEKNCSFLRQTYYLKTVEYRKTNFFTNYFKSDSNSAGSNYCNLTKIYFSTSNQHTARKFFKCFIWISNLLVINLLIGWIMEFRSDIGLFRTEYTHCWWKLELTDFPECAQHICNTASQRHMSDICIVYIALQITSGSYYYYWIEISANFLNSYEISILQPI